MILKFNWFFFRFSHFCWVPFLFLILLFFNIFLKILQPSSLLNCRVCVCFLFLFLLLLLFRVIVIRLVWKTVKIGEKGYLCHAMMLHSYSIHLNSGSDQPSCWYIRIFHVSLYFIQSTGIGILICWILNIDILLVHNLLFSIRICSSLKYNKIIIVTK